MVRDRRVGAGKPLASCRRMLDLAAAPFLEDDDDRPRERLWARGAHAISDEELIAILVSTGTRGRPARQVATEVLRRAGGVATLSRATPRELAQIDGIGASRASQLVAAFELGRRAIERATRREAVCRAEDVHRRLAPRLAGLQQEVFVVLGIDVRNRVLEEVEVARGSVAGVEVHPREVFRPLIRMAAAAAVLVHNHPSGDPAPSQEDLALTHRLREIGQLLGVPVIDHVIIADQGFRSVAEYMGVAF
jgi:DNA repair protein RadC